MKDGFSFATYTVRKKMFNFLGQAFHIYNPQNELVFYTKQKAFKIKEDIRVYTGEDMAEEALVIKARNILDISTTYDVLQPGTEESVGALRRKGLKSIVKDEWLILDTADREIGSIKEDSAASAIVRRLLGSLGQLLFPQSYHGYIQGQEVCRFKQNFNPFVLKITLDFADDVGGLLDRRIGIAAAILLCAIEGRQN